MRQTWIWNGDTARRYWPLFERLNWERMMVCKLRLRRERPT